MQFPFALDLIDKCAKGWSCMAFEYTRFSEREWAFVSPLTPARITIWPDPIIHFPGWDLENLNWRDGLFGTWILETPFRERKGPKGMTLHYHGRLISMEVNLSIPKSGVLRISTSAKIHNPEDGSTDLHYFQLQTNLSEIIRIAERITEVAKLQLPLLPDRLVYHWLECVRQQFHTPKIQIWMRKKSDRYAERLVPHFPKVLIPIILSFLLGQQLFQKHKKKS